MTASDAPLKGEGGGGSRRFTLRFLCGWRSGRGGGLGPGFDGGPVLTLSGRLTFLRQRRGTQEVHRSTLVLQGGGGQVWREDQEEISDRFTQHHGSISGGALGERP